MVQLGYFELIGFGPNGWGAVLLAGMAMTILVAVGGFFCGALIGAAVAWAKLSRSLIAKIIADLYTTILRGVPDLLVIYLFYFGGSSALTMVGGVFGAEGFIGVPSFITGVIALGVVSGAYQAEVMRGAYGALAKGELEAARSVGMHKWLMFRRIIIPQVLRYAIPGLGNVWQLILKQSALISVTGLIELLYVSKMASGSTRQPFVFYLTAGALYLAITAVTGWAFRRLEDRMMRSVRRA